VLFALMLCSTAQAYIDPNAPGLIYQLLFPVFVALTVARTWVVRVVKRIFQLLIRFKH
jgi:hypothetical protein